jgi:hypothetical protein
MATTKNKLGFIIGWDWDSVKSHVDTLKTQDLEVHVFTFPSKASTFPSTEKVHVLKEPTAQGMDCIANVLKVVEAGIELAKKDKKDIHTIINTLTIPKIWNFDTTLDNWKKLFWFQWDHKEYVDDVVVRTWNSIKPKPQPIKAVESTEE